MSNRFNILIAGFLISFIGSLPFGTLNLTAFRIASVQNVQSAISFAVAVVIIELIIVRITLAKINKIDLSNKIFSYIFPITILFLIYLSISSFLSIQNPQSINLKTPLFPVIQSSFLLGLLLSGLNPLQIPFWVGWNSVLFERKTLNKKPGIYILYIMGIGIGTMAGLLIFIFSGRYIIQNIQQYNGVISFLMGLLYLSFSLYIFYLFYKNHLKLRTI